MQQVGRETDSREVVRSWLRRVERQTGLKTTALATKAGIAPSTLLRFLGEDSTGYLSQRSIDKIVTAFGVEPPTSYNYDAALAASQHDRHALLAGFQEAEVEQLGDVALVALQLTTLRPESPNQSVWRINSRGLELLGYMPGDIALLDQAEAPRRADVVCAQAYSADNTSAESVFRYYDPPYLLTRTADPGAQRKPLLVDGERVVIMGVVVRSMRVRR